MVYDNKGCRFEPHVLALWIKEGLELHNSDPIGHNSNLQPLGGEPINPLLPPAVPPIILLPRPRDCRRRSRATFILG